MNDVTPDLTAAGRIRAARLAQGRRTAVLDDDPTGSQSVNGVSISAPGDDADYLEPLAAPGATCFILTNTRSLAEADAIEVNLHVAAKLIQLEQESGAPVDIVSRGDSTLRGHVLAEVTAIDEARKATTGRGYDGVLFAPAYFEAGRFTSGDVHFATVGGVRTPVGETEFAADATFGYRASNLREFVSEKSGGAIRVDDVLSIGLDDIREGGVERVAAILMEAHELAFIVVNGEDFPDFEVVVLAVEQAERAGRRFLFRAGPSFVRALIGLEGRPSLTATELWEGEEPRGHGLVVVGSHVGQTARQLARARERYALDDIELSVPEVLADASGDYVRGVATRVRQALATRDVLFTTSRSLIRHDDPETSLAYARAVSAAVMEVVRVAIVQRPAWVIAKGGITSHDVAVHGLGMRRATVLGQFFPGMVSALRIDRADDPAVEGTRYVVFAGNVGDDDALADVIGMLSNEVLTEQGRERADA
jgi:uncharacterized protein YgbK (DUF1537 family)